MRTCCGIDLVEIDRFRNLKPEILNRFFQRVFTKEELDYIGGRMERAAGLFAAKEAVVKVLGCGIGPVSWQEIKVLHTNQGAPTIILLGNAVKIANSMRASGWSLSISHTRHLANAVAFCLLSDR